MTDEVMEPLTGTEFDKKKFEKRSSRKSIDVIENTAILVETKTPDKKRKKFFPFNKASKAKQDPFLKKKGTKSELITNSIQNPSNHPIPDEKQPDSALLTNHLSDPSPRNSPDVSEDTNDSDTLLKDPPVGLATHLPRTSQTSIPPFKKSNIDPQQESVTHALSLLSPGTQDPPPEQDTSKPEPNPVLSGKPSPWSNPPPTTECSIESNLGLSRSCELSKDPPIAPLSAPTSNSYDSHLNSETTSVEIVFPTDPASLIKAMSHESQSSLDDSQVDYSYSDTNSQPLLPDSDHPPKVRTKSLTCTHQLSYPFLITETEFQSFTSYFSTLNPQDGLLYGEQARAYFLRSELPTEELSRIWKLSDIDNDKKLTSTEFCIAMKLVRNRKKGIPLPTTLPPSLLESLRTLTNLTDEPGPLPQTDLDLPPDVPSQSEDTPLLDIDTPENSVSPSLEVHRNSDSPNIKPTPAQLEETDLLTSDLSQPESSDGREIEETLTLENIQRDPQDEIEDPIPKLSNSSGPIDYKDQIKSIFTPTPNPIPPPPSKTEMKQRSVLTPNVMPPQDTSATSPKIDITPVVQMRSHIVGTSSFVKPSDDTMYNETIEDPMILSITKRGGTDPKGMAKSKYNRGGAHHRRPDRISAVVLIDQEDSHVSLINKGEVRTYELSPRVSDDQQYTFTEVLDNEPVKFRERLTPLSSPTKTIETQKTKPKMKIKFLMRKKNSNSTASIEKAGNGDPLMNKKKKRREKKSSKKDKTQHKRSSSLIEPGNTRLYSSHSDLSAPNRQDNRKMVCAITSDGLSKCYSPYKSSSTLSLTPPHKERHSLDIQDDNDSFDSPGSSEEIPSEGDNDVVLRTHLNNKVDYRNNRSLSSPECIMSTTPVPGPDTDTEDYRYTTASEIDEKTPMHEPEVLSNSQIRENLKQRILDMACRCESLRGINTDLRNELNQIRLQKKELKMQLRFRKRNLL